jgi:hypothetical protein
VAAGFRFAGSGAGRLVAGVDQAVAAEPRNATDDLAGLVRALL